MSHPSVPALAGACIAKRRSNAATASRACVGNGHEVSMVWAVTTLKICSDRSYLDRAYSQIAQRPGRDVLADPALMVLAGCSGGRPGQARSRRAGSAAAGKFLALQWRGHRRTYIARRGRVVHIAVAGTVFSITIAALSLAAGQIGPRLLRNFTRDRGNQLTLGAFLGTFSYALMVLRSVRTQGEGEFVPHLSLSVGILLAFVCVATLVYFVGHMAGRINVDTVIELVSEDVRSAI